MIDDLVLPVQLLRQTRRIPRQARIAFPLFAISENAAPHPLQDLASVSSLSRQRPQTVAFLLIGKQPTEGRAQIED